MQQLNVASRLPLSTGHAARTIGLGMTTSVHDCDSDQKVSTASFSLVSSRKRPSTLSKQNIIACDR